MLLLKSERAQTIGLSTLAPARNVSNKQLPGKKEFSDDKSM
jgi:hypothetical protein